MSRIDRDLADQRAVAGGHAVEALQHAVAELDCRLAAEDQQKFLQPEDGHARGFLLSMPRKFAHIKLWNRKHLVQHLVLRFTSIILRLARNPPVPQCF